MRLLEKERENVRVRFRGWDTMARNGVLEGGVEERWEFVVVRVISALALGLEFK